MSNLHDIKDLLSSYHGVRIEIISQQEIGFTCILCLRFKGEKTSICKDL